jgi:hypothetical protein
MVLQQGMLTPPQVLLPDPHEPLALQVSARSPQEAPTPMHTLSWLTQTPPEQRFPGQAGCPPPPQTVQVPAPAPAQARSAP